ncbi:MAG: ASKHA domain-containing protein [Candidatus Omnitrophica bacterium]|nr:ASKHA domain-containing protein [Candidatus Omnitrophota bacterium]
MKYVVITFHPDKKRVAVPLGSDILTASIKANIFLASSCGGKGMCGRCKVKILDGEFDSEPTGKISESEKKNNIFLACRTFAKGNLEVKIFPETILPSRIAPAIFEKGMEIHVPELLKKTFPIHPLTKKYFLRLPRPSINDNISDIERIYRALKKYDINIHPAVDMPTLRKIPSILRESNWEITVTLDEDNSTILLVEQGDTSKMNYGIAVDVGTTTIVVSLINLNNGETIGSESSFNSQSVYGDDVITRIIYAEKKQGLETLHHLVVSTINELIQNIAKNHSITLNNITSIVAAGNMTMAHLLLKVDPSFLRREPYIPSSNTFPAMFAAEIGIKINPSGIFWTVGGAASYVGGDITAGVLATGMYKEENPNMLIDIGTNGEIVLGDKNWLLCASASAGPAFEGTGVKNGTRAIEGAIQSFKIENGKTKISTIGDKTPMGICGSGYIEIISELFRNGIIDRSGKFTGENEKTRNGEDGREFIVYKGDGRTKDIVITQIDIENLLRAKAAIFAAIFMLLEKSGILWENIEKIYIAGGFGNFLNIKLAISIGLLPQIPEEKFVFVGDTSLAGAKAALVSKEARKISYEIIKNMTYLDLSTEKSYMEEYLGALFIPHTNMERFSLIKK